MSTLQNGRMELPETRYARSGDVNIAYQVVGEGPFDLVFVPGYVTHLELSWKLPTFAPALIEFASYARLIRLDKRGTGMSDPVRGAPTLETRMDDVRAVMDAVGSSRAALFGVSEGASMGVLFAATVTGSSPPSTGPPAGSAARARSSSPCGSSASTCVQACTRASARSRTARQRGSPCTPAPASRGRREAARSSCRARSRISSRARGSSSATWECASCRASPR
jgi:hypothetical protein